MKRTGAVILVGVLLLGLLLALIRPADSSPGTGKSGAQKKDGISFALGAAGARRVEVVTPRQGPIAATIEANAGDAVAAEDSGEPPTRIVRSRRLRVSPMSAEDAVLELEGTKGQLLVFRDAASSRINVLHQREDGSYDLLDLEP